MKHFLQSLLLGLTLAFGTSIINADTVADADILTFTTPEAEENYNKLVEELRCLVCQNQNLAGSDADLAKDLRSQVYDMVEAGQSRTDVIDYMVTRYGDFVLYRPAFKLKTLLLWLGPIVFLLLTLWLVMRWVRSQSVKSTETLSDTQRETVRDLLDKHK